MINVVIADDETILRESIKYRLNIDESINIVGCAGNGYETIDLCEKGNVDVVLMDIKMPECDGIAATKIIKEKYSFIKIIILTTFTNDKSFRTAISNGADGYLLKDVTPDILINAIKNVHSNLKIIHDDVFQMLSDVKDTLSEENQHIYKHDLSEKEILIVQLIVQGKSTQEMSKELFLSEGRVRNLIADILNKLKLRDRVQLAVYAIKNKIV